MKAGVILLSSGSMLYCFVVLLYRGAAHPGCTRCQAGVCVMSQTFGGVSQHFEPRLNV